MCVREKARKRDHVLENAIDQINNDQRYDEIIEFVKFVVLRFPLPASYFVIFCLRPSPSYPILESD